MGGACGAPRLLGIYLISKMHTTTIQKIQKAYIKTYEEDVNISKDIENSQEQFFFFLFAIYYTKTDQKRPKNRKAPRSFPPKKLSWGIPRKAQKSRTEYQKQARVRFPTLT